MTRAQIIKDRVAIDASQIISGALAKARQHAATAYEDEANAWGTPNQNISATGKWQEAGVSISPIGKHDIFIPAGAMRPTNTSGCAALAQNETTTNLVNYNSLDFDQTTSENAYFTVSLPRKYNNGTITAFFYWSAAAGTGGVAWGLKALARSDDDPLDTAFGTEVVTTDTLIVTGDQHISAESSAITIGGTPADADEIYFNIARKVADAGDTLTADAKLLGVKIVITTDAAVDA